MSEGSAVNPSTRRNFRFPSERLQGPGALPEMPTAVGTSVNPYIDY